jgi:hypothetical protein
MPAATGVSVSFIATLSRLPSRNITTAATINPLASHSTQDIPLGIFICLQLTQRYRSEIQEYQFSNPRIRYPPQVCYTFTLDS